MVLVKRFRGRGQVVLQFTICNGLESVREILPFLTFTSLPIVLDCSGLFWIALDCSAWNPICVVAFITNTNCVEQSQDVLKQALN